MKEFIEKITERRDQISKDILEMRGQVMHLFDQIREHAAREAELTKIIELAEADLPKDRPQDGFPAPEKWAEPPPPVEVPEELKKTTPAPGDLKISNEVLDNSGHQRAMRKPANIPDGDTEARALYVLEAVHPKVVRTSELQKWLGGSAHWANNVCARLVKKGCAERVRRGTYLFVKMPGKARRPQNNKGMGPGGSTVEQDILDALKKANGPMKRDEIAKAIGKHREYTGKTLVGLMINGSVEKVTRGVYKLGKVVQMPAPKRVGIYHQITEYVGDNPGTTTEGIMKNLTDLTHKQISDGTRHLKTAGKIKIEGAGWVKVA